MQDKKITFCKMNSPLNEEKVWQLESFLLRTFEYGDYSFRRALRGTYNSNLQCTFFIARVGSNVIAAAGCLYSKENSTIAIMGPVCVDAALQRKGLATRLCNSLLSHLEDQGTLAVYLGVRKGHPARQLYTKLGFKSHTGIVMRKFLVNEEDFFKRFSGKDNVSLCQITWADYPAVSALMCESVNSHTFHFSRGSFAVRDIESQKFLSVFPEMMKAFEEDGGFANGLISDSRRDIVGIAHVLPFASTSQQHMAVIDFFIQDDYATHASSLISHTLKRIKSRHPRKTICFCPSCDHAKRNIMESLGARKTVALPGYLNINNNFEDVFIYAI